MWLGDYPADTHVPNGFTLHDDSFTALHSLSFALFQFPIAPPSERTMERALRHTALGMENEEKLCILHMERFVHSLCTRSNNKASVDGWKNINK